VELLDTMPPAQYGPKQRTYPWDKWLVPGQRVRLRQGEDYQAQTTSVRRSARKEAERRRLSLVTVKGEDERGEWLALHPEEMGA
jgi:hypothetical protein